MAKASNRIVTNRKSPQNESKYIKAYQEHIPSSKKSDHLDISAVKTKSGETGHALLKPEFNRSKDRNPHIGIGFVSDSQLRKEFKKK